MLEKNIQECKNIEINNLKEKSLEEKISEFVDVLCDVGEAIVKLKKKEETITIEGTISSK